MMPHDRKRHLYHSFSNLIRHAKIVGIFGHRQVGKTTFLEANSQDYITLDDHEELDRAQNTPKAFLKSMKGAHSAIDECQLAPSLFPALKLAVQKNKKPGQFILSGSVRFTSRKAIRESLTGRIAGLELYPMTVTEIDEDHGSQFFIKALEHNDYNSFMNELQTPKSILRSRNKAIEKYFLLGGLPGICFIRNPQTRKNMIGDVIKTILSRDIRLVYETTVPDFRIFNLCTEIARTPLVGFHPTLFRKNTGLSESTQKKLVQALEAVFLVRRIPIEGDYRGDLLWFEDQTERYYFQNIVKGTFEDWIGCVYRHLRAQFGYTLGYTPEYFHYKTRSKAMMPIAVRHAQSTLGIYPLLNENEPTKAQLTSAKNFLSHYQNSKVVFVTYAGREPELIRENIILVSAAHAFY